MKKIFFLLIVLTTLNSCISIAPKHHRHIHYFHKRPIITSDYFERKYMAPSRAYRKRGF